MTGLSTRIIARNAFTGYIILLTRIGLGFFLTPFIIRSVGADDYGLWLLVLSVTGYFYLADLGFGQAIVRYVAMERVDGRQKHLDQLVSTFLVVYSFLGIAVAAVALSLTPAFPTIFKVSSEQAAQSQFVMLAIGLAVAVSIPLNLFGGYLQGHQRYDLSNGVEWVASLANGVLTVLVLPLGYGLMALVVITVATNLAAGVARLVLAIRLTPDLRIGLHNFQPRLIREISSYSISFFVVSAAVVVCHRTDQVVIGLFLPMTAVAIFGVNQRLVELGRSLAGQIGNVLLPVAADLHARADQAKLRTVLIEGTKFGTAFMMVVAVQLFALSRPFLDLWVGPSFGEGYPALVVLTVVSIAALAGDTSARILLTSDRQRVVALASMADAAANATLSVILVQRLGLLGVALGTAVPFLAVTCFNIACACRLLRLPVAQMVRSSLVPVLLPAVPAGAALVLLTTWAYPQSWPVLIAEGLIGSAVYFLAFSFTGISAEQRNHCVAVTTKRWPLAKRALG